MKIPYNRITAFCINDGKFQVDRKPKTGQKTTCGQPNETYKKVVCPTCRMWADVTKVEEIR